LRTHRNIHIRTACARGLPVRQVNLCPCRSIKPGILYIVDNPDDRAPLFVAARAQAATDGVLVGPECHRHGFVDDGNLRRILNVARFEQPPIHQANAH
jgi:hypothetical protein